MARLVLPLVSLFVLLISSDILAQTGSWVELPLSRRIPYVVDMDMADQDFGIMVTKADIANEFSGVITTSDGWDHFHMWESISPTFDPELPEWTRWRGVYIYDKWNAWIVGDSALCYVSYNGGITWTKQDVDWDNTRFNSPPTLHDVVFTDQGTGVIVGGDGVDAILSGGEMHLAQVFTTTSGGMDWTEQSIPPQYIGTGIGALTEVDYAGGKFLMGGEFGLLFSFDLSGLYLPILLVSQSAQNEYMFQDIDMATATDHVIVGYRDFAFTPIAFKSLLNGTRYASLPLPNVPPTVKGYGCASFINADQGMLGAGQHYLAVTADGGRNWNDYDMGFNPPQTPLTAISMINSQTGFACGGDSSANTGWVLRFYGVPPKADISFSSTELVFSDIRCERSVEGKVFIRNKGTGPMTITANDINFSSPEYEVVNSNIFPFTLRPYKEVELTIRWNPHPSYSGTQIGTMYISSNDPDHNPWPIRLEGTRHHGALSFLDEMYVSFGTCLGDTLEYQIPVQATGNLPPEFIGIEFVSGHDDFSLVAPDPGTVVNGSEVFNFVFAPQDTTNRRGIYRLIYGDPSCPDTSLVALNGIGQLSVIAASSTTIDFGEICVNDIKDTTIILQNLGNTFTSIGWMEYASGDHMFASPNRGVVLLQDSAKSFRLQFKPWQAGEFEGTYRLTYGLCTDTLLLTLKGKALETVLEFDPKSPVRIGPIFANRVAGQTITISNPGKTAARITDIRFSTQLPVLQMTTKPPLPKTLLPGQVTNIVLRFQPVTPGEYNTKIYVEWDARCAASDSVEINAICVPNPEIDPPASADLGIQPCPEPLVDTVLIHNRGNGPLVFYSISVSGPDNKHFRVLSPVANDTVPPASSFPMLVEFNRTTEGRSHGILRLTHNDTHAGMTDIDVMAERTIAEFIVEGDSTTEFFTRLFVPEQRQFIIRNTSNQTVTITDIRVTREGTVFDAEAVQTLPVTLQPTQTLAFDVTFTPNARGPFNAIVEIESDPCATVHALGLTGTGDTDGLSTDRGDITYALDPCSFQTDCEKILLKNLGPEPVEVTDLSILHSGSVFAIDPPVAVPFVMNPNQEKTLTICAVPSFLGNESGSLVITSNDPAYPTLTIALMASHDSVAVTASETSVDFGRLADCDDVQPRNIVFTNTGTLPEILDISFQNGSAFTSSVMGSMTIPSGKNAGLFVEFTRPGYGDFNDVLILTSQRCQTEIRIPLHAEAVEQIYVATPDPLTFPTVNVGGATTRQLTLQNGGGIDAHIGSVDITPTGTFSIVSGVPAPVAAGTSENIGIRFNPQSEGSFTATACIIITAPCMDTVCVTLEGEGVKGTLEVQPPMLAYGTRAQCQDRTLFDTLRNTGSGTITILSADINGTDAAAFSNLTPITAPEAVAASSMRIFEIRFDPALVGSDGPVDAALTIHTDDNVLPQFDIPLEGERVTLLADAGGTLDFGPVEVGNAAAQTVTLTNNGSVQLCYDSEQLPAGVSMLPATPFCIDPGSTLDITLTYTAPASGALREALTLYVNAPCADSTVYNLRADAQKGTLTQPDTLRITGHPWCEEGNFSFSIQSSFLEDITLDDMQFVGADAAYFQILSPDPSTLPLTIQSGGSEQVMILLTPDQQTRTFTATLVSSFTAFGSPVERRTVLIAEVVVPELSIAAGGFVATVVGQSGGTGNMRITNESSLPMDIDAVTTSTASFVILSLTPPPPVTLQPGQTMMAVVEFVPQTVGLLTDSLQVQSDAPCALKANGLLIGEGIPQPIVDATLSIGNLSAKVDELLDIAVMVDKDLGPAQISGWSGSISFNRTMLYPVAVLTESTLSSAMQVQMHYDNAAGTAHLTADGAEVAAGAGALVIVRCRVLVGNAISTALTLSNDFGFTDGYATVIGRQDGNFDLIEYCLPGDRLVTDRPGFILHQNRPNPVSLGEKSVTTISYNLPVETSVMLDLYDMIGRHVRRIDQGRRAKGVHTMNLDIADLQPGTYLYVLRSTANTAVRKMVVVR